MNKSEALPIIRLRTVCRKRVTEWKVHCDEHGSLSEAASKASAAKVALEHAEEVHNRAAHIQMPA